MNDVSVGATRELATFLRSRRESLNPQDLGLPLRRARRTPGLRREEVAELAGISTDYIVRLEQARGLRPSAEVADALARALHLAPDERTYLFGLARLRPRDADKPATAAAPALTQLIADLSPWPAMIVNHRYDILSWNSEMAAMMLDFDTLPSSQRNVIWLCLLHPQMREVYIDRERVVRDGIAHLRTAWAMYPDDEVLSGLIAECINGDEDVARRWSEPEVTLSGRRHKVMRHPDHGLIATDCEVLMPLNDPDQIVVVHRGADDTSRAALNRLGTDEAPRSDLGSAESGAHRALQP